MESELGGHQEPVPLTGFEFGEKKGRDGEAEDAFRLAASARSKRPTDPGRPRGHPAARQRLLNKAAFVIHSQVRAARPDVVAAAHSHSLHGKAFSSLGIPLDPIAQDACAFFEDHGLHADGVHEGCPHGDCSRRACCR
jgi:hypothetical protein